VVTKKYASIKQDEMVIEDELKGIKRKWPWPIAGNRKSLLKQYLESVHPVAFLYKRCKYISVRHNTYLL